MSVEKYEEMQGKLELYNCIQEGIRDVKRGKSKPLSDVMDEIRNSLK